MVFVGLIGEVHAGRTDGFEILQELAVWRGEIGVTFALADTLHVFLEHAAAQIENIGAQDLQALAIDFNIADETDDGGFVHVDEILHEEANVAHGDLGIIVLFAALHLVNVFADVVQIIADAVEVVDDEDHARCTLSLSLVHFTSGEDCREIALDLTVQRFDLIGGGNHLLADVLHLFLARIAHSVEHTAHEIGDADGFVGRKLDGSHWLVEHAAIEEAWFGNGAGNGGAFFVRQKLADDLHHEEEERCPDERHDDVKSGVSVGDLAGNDFDLRPLWRDQFNNMRVWHDKPDEDQRTTDVENAVCERGTLGVEAEPYGSDQRGDGGPDVVAEKHWQRADKTDEAAAVRAGCGGNILEHSDGGAGALNEQRHAETGCQTENWHVGNLLDHFSKDRAGGQRFHDGAHDLDPVKEQTKAKDRGTEVLDLFFLGKKIEQKTDDDDEVDIIAEIKRNQLRGHRRPDVCTKNDRNGLWQRHQPSADEADGHNGRCRTGLQHSSDQRARENPEHRIFREHAEDRAHAFAGDFLQAVAHEIHPIKEDREPSEQPKNNL